MKFKYQNEFNDMEELCPPHDCLKGNLAAYRWVFDEVEAEGNFLPLAKKNPSRVLSMRDKDKCKAHSLSMFVSKESAKKRFQYFYDGLMKEKAFKMLGTHIAEGNIKEIHGVNSIEDRRGHFSHFQYEKVDLSVIFRIIESLK